jgi:hypothetical protein
MSFERWMLTIDGLCRIEFGMSIYDLPDMCFRDAFDAGQSPTDFMEEYVPDVQTLAELVLS